MAAEKDLTSVFKFSTLALFVAYRALMNNETPVACIFVSRKTNKILSFGCNDTNKSLNGTRHAEFMGIDKILKEFIPKNARSDIKHVKSFFQDVTLYVTVEPCIMCALALKHLGIGEVIYGCSNDRFGGTGTVLPINQDDREDTINNYASFGGILRTEAIQLLRNFYIQENDTAPLPKIKKNKELENKLYPPNPLLDKYLSLESFTKFYGEERARFYKSQTSFYEITPQVNSGYTLEDFIDINAIKSIPKIKDLYVYDDMRDDVLLEDLESFLKLFYSVNNKGMVDFDGKQIVKVDEIHLENKKKRKLAVL